MVETEYGKSGTALLWTVSGTRPGYMAIGSGSGTVSVNNSGLFYDLNLRQAFSQIDISVPKNVTFQGDWGASTLSGLNATEFGITTGSSGLGLWTRDQVSTITFDGTVELQIQITQKTF